MKNKFLLGLSLCTLFFGLGNLSVLAQTRKPTTAEVQQAKANLSQQVQSLKSGNLAGYIKDYRTPQQRQNREKLVKAWQKVNPEIAPYLGSWTSPESALGIHPSNIKGRVCIIETQPEGLTLDIGNVVNNSIYTSQGKVFYEEGNYLGMATIRNNQFNPIGGIPLHSPRTLQNPNSFESIDGLSASKQLLKAYADAGCTSSFPTNNASKSNSKSILKQESNKSNGKQAQTKTTTLPSRQLVDAIRKHTINANYSDVRYSFVEVDLNNDGNKDAIVYETGSHCGMAICYLQIFAKIGNQYRLLSEQNALPTYNAKVAILRDSNSGWINIAMPAFSYNPSEYDKVKGWRIYKFNGTEYAQTSVLNSINQQTLIDFENSKMFELGN